MKRQRASMIVVPLFGLLMSSVKPAFTEPQQSFRYDRTDYPVGDGTSRDSQRELATKCCFITRVATRECVEKTGVTSGKWLADRRLVAVPCSVGLQASCTQVPNGKDRLRGRQSGTGE